MGFKKFFEAKPDNLGRRCSSNVASSFLLFYDLSRHVAVPVAQLSRLFDELFV